VIIVVRNLTRFGEGLPKTSYGEREVDMLAPVRAALAEQQARVELKSTFLFYETRGGPLSLKVVRGGAWFRLLRLARLRERPLYQCRHTYATLLLSEGLNPLYVAHQIGHSTVAMVVRHYARWTHKPPGRDAERVERSLAAGLVPPKMPEFRQKTVDSNPFGGHIDRTKVRGIAGEIGNAERWPSGRRHQIANLASWVTGTEGSNPSLSAKLQYFLASNVMVKPLSKRLR